MSFASTGSAARRTMAPLVVAAISLALVAGCSSNPGSANKGDGAGGATGVLNVGMPQGATVKNNSNPLLPTSAAAVLGYRYMIYEPLAMVNLVKPTEPAKPWLASKFEWADNYRTLTLTARDGVTFSDGKPMTAEDIAYSFQLMKDNKALNTSALPIESVTASGKDVTVKFGTSQFVRQAVVLSTLVLPKHLWSAIADPATDTVENPVGTGPYTLKSFTPQTVTLTTRNGYWQDAPKIKELRYTTYSGNDAITSALTSGALEWTYAFIPDAKKLYTAKDPEHNKLWFPANLSADGLWINTTNKPFDNPALRRAMSVVINRQDIFNQASAGYFKPAVESITGLPTPIGDAFISPEYQGKKSEGDVASAKKILTDAGFTYNGETLQDPTGKPVTLTMTDPAGWGDYQTTLTIISDNLKQIGIKATPEKADQDAWFTAIANGNFQAAMHWSNGGATPYDMYQNIMDGAGLQPVGSPATNNYGRFDNKEATKALADYANAADEASRKAALATLQRIFVEQMPMIPTSAGNYGAEYSTKNWTGWPDDSNPYAPIQPTQVNALDVVLHLKPAH
ncbi:ABC transporter substrate-binding protein [Kitasatospora sp. NPDC048365]|uniref:ABC transporter substrate-binding protein n=1 Tax=Kitasatospora sp. NPDC048365 TaxID=3364050 RepID=UPI00371771FE